MLKPFLVSYDLNQPGQEYPPVTSELKKLGAVRVLYSEWVLKSSWSALELAKHLWKFMDPNDSLLVVEIDRNKTASAGLMNHQSFEQLMAA